MSQIKDMIESKRINNAVNAALEADRGGDDDVAVGSYVPVHTTVVSGYFWPSLTTVRSSVWLCAHWFMDRVSSV